MAVETAGAMAGGPVSDEGRGVTPKTVLHERPSRPTPRRSMLLSPKVAMWQRPKVAMWQRPKVAMWQQMLRRRAPEERVAEVAMADVNAEES
jgi:hypothetical protein